MQNRLSKLIRTVQTVFPSIQDPKDVSKLLLSTANVCIHKTINPVCLYMCRFPVCAEGAAMGGRISAFAKICML